ncbi:MAG: Glycogen synthase [Syntrophus sp. PtaB.Bin138]|nr:MAG: Glycogen synthase [Syntrophus sp. PtaB.Bin138]
MAKMIMIGPSLAGLGGISRVLSIWRDGGIFSENDISYVSSVSARPARRIFSFVLNFSKYLRLLLTAADTVYVHSAANNSFWRKSFFLVFAMMFKKKIVLHIHPSHFYDFIMSLKGFPRRFAFYLLNRLTALIVLSDEMRDRFSALFKNKPIYVLRNPVDMKSLSNIEGTPREQNRILFLGWYVPEKGIYELADAVALLIRQGLECSLDLYGTKQRQALEKYVNSLKVGDKIRVHGWISGTEKVNALYRSAILALPSYREGMPNVVLEAMATKLPLVATPVGALKEILTDGVNSLICQPRDAAGLASRLRQLLEDDRLRQTLAERAFADVKANYDIQVIRSRFRELMKSLKEGRQTGA